MGQVHRLGLMDMSVGAAVGNHIGRMVKYDDENNYGPWRKICEYGSRLTWKNI